MKIQNKETRMASIPDTMEKIVHIPSLISVWERHGYRLNDGDFLKEKAEKACTLLKGLPFDEKDDLLKIDEIGNPDNRLTAVFFSRADDEHGALGIITHHIKRFPFEHPPENLLETINKNTPEPGCEVIPVDPIIILPL